MKVKILAVAAAVAVLGVGALAGSAIAGGGPANDSTSRTTTRAVGGAEAPNARLSAFVQAGGTVVRSKGVTGVSHPSAGVYCVDPKVATLNVNKAIPSLSVDWSTSLGDALMAQWRSAGIGCPSGQFSILTFDGEDGSFDLSDGVSFTINVP